MPELIEVEIYRRTATKTIGRTVATVDVLDPFGLRNSPTTPASVLHDTLVGATVTAARRIGKLLLLDLACPESTDLTAWGGRRDADRACEVLGLRFGMTGRLIVDEDAGIDELLYASGRNDPAWDRFRVSFTDGGMMSVRDPRRLGGVELDPDLSRFGPDATVLTLRELRSVLAGSVSPVKARIMDQGRVAGIGNLLADEILWRAGISPGVAALSLSSARVSRLHASIIDTVADLTARGGSHLGDVMEARHPGGLCPRDGAAMRVAQIGGRTSWWCPKHQR